MSEIITLFYSYPLWVRLVIGAMFAATVLLLLVFKSDPVDETEAVSEARGLGLSPIEIAMLRDAAEPCEIWSKRLEPTAARIGTHNINAEQARASLVDRGLLMDGYIRDNDEGANEKLVVLSPAGKKFVAENQILDR